MAKIVEHGRFWKEEQRKAYPDFKIQCPECDGQIVMSSYDFYITTPTPELWCKCGCRFIPEKTDILEDPVNARIKRRLFNTDDVPQMQ